MNKMKLEIFCDASIRKFPNGRTFGCAGAICPAYNDSTKLAYKLEVLPDSTNNESEITAIYLAVILAKEIIETLNLRFEDVDITIYSDSKISVFGLKVWMEDWLKYQYNGVLFNSQGMKVKNQHIFLRVLSFLITNNMKIKLYHVKGHVKLLNIKSLAEAARVFYESNGFNVPENVLNKIALNNNTVDDMTRKHLMFIKPDDFIMRNDPEGDLMCHYVIADNWKEYIQ